MKQRYYAGGVDWVIAALDHVTRKASGCGNVSQLILELDGMVDEQRLDRAVGDFTAAYPFLHGRFKRGWNLCPYWQPCPPGKKIGVRFIKLASGAQALSLLNDQLNRPFDEKTATLRFTCVTLPQKSYFSMVFDHRVLDARGAEAFISAFNEFFVSGAKPPVFDLSQPAHLDRWAERFRAGQKVNRALRKIFSGLAHCPSTGSRRLTDTACRFETIHFDAGESQRIIDRAEELSGYLMFMPYALAASVCALSRIIRTGAGQADYIVPVSIDMRRSEEVKRNMFFNHFSFFFFRVPANGSFKEVLASVKAQMYEQVQSGLPAALEKVSYLMRIVPLGLFSRLLQDSLGAGVSTFAFTCTGNSEYAGRTFCGVPIAGLTHTPRVPFPPGLGVYFTGFDGKLTATVSYYADVVDPTLAKESAQTLRNTL